jgi:hypothetical protein
MLIEPVITGPALRFDSWSPDNQWFAYWVSEKGKAKPASLAFFNVRSKESCHHTNVIAADRWSGWLQWQDSGRVVAHMNEADATMTGTLCQTFTDVDDINLIKSQITYSHSPNGRYYAETIYDPSGGQLISYTVTITNADTAQIVTSFSWQASIYLRASEPGWLNDELYLIGQTFQEGVLYLSTSDGQPHNLLTDLMQVTTFDNETLWLVFHETDPATGAYHILLQWQGGTSYENWSPLLLYHGELNLVEELPFYKARAYCNLGACWGLLPAGRWLLIGDAVEDEDPANDEGRDNWLRSADPPGSEAMEIVSRAELGGLSPTGEQIARSQSSGSIQILTFPERQIVGEWHAAGHRLAEIWWSPDGSHLAVAATNPEVLFVIDP